MKHKTNSTNKRKILNMAETNWQSLVGKSLGTSDWFTVDQQRIDAFAEATLDQQFIHTDPIKAAQTPLGGTIAHGLLILSLVPHFLYPMLEEYQSDNSTFLNYGTDKVRFINPVRAGSNVRCNVTIAGCEAKDDGSQLLRLAIIIDIQGEDRPAVVADALMLILTNES